MNSCRLQAGRLFIVVACLTFWGFLLFFCSPMVSAVQSAEQNTLQELIIFEIHHTNSEYEVTRSSVLMGYLPDYVDQPNSGFVSELLDYEGNQLFAFSFNDPSLIFTDSLGPLNSTSGGLSRLSDAHFAIVMPYDPSASELRIYDSSGYIILSYTLESGPKLRIYFLWFGLLLLCFFVLVLFFKRRSNL